MINIQQARKAFEVHTKNLTTQGSRIQTKKEHMYRVSIISQQIATQLNLNQEQIKLAELIGLLHDIGRFEQYKIGTESSKFDHGLAGVEILKKDNNIRKYIQEEQYDEIIYKAIYEHNKYGLSKDITKEQELFCKIIKDADKIDLIYEAVYVYWQDQERKELVEQGKLSEKMLEDFYNHKLADSKNRISETDQILRFSSFIFDINFPYSFKIIKESNNVSKMIDKFDYKISETKEKMKEVKKIAEEYIQEKAK